MTQTEKVIEVAREMGWYTSLGYIITSPKGTTYDPTDEDTHKLLMLAIQEKTDLAVVSDGNGEVDFRFADKMWHGWMPNSDLPLAVITAYWEQMKES